MTNKPRHSVSVAGIVVNEDGRVLVVQRRDNSHWEPPGGILELHESPEDGVRREVREETGIDVYVEHLSGVYKNMSIGVVSLVFRCRPVRGSPVVTQESKSVRWMSISDAESAMYPAYAVRVSDAFGAETHVRSHDGENLIPVQGTLPARKD